MEDGVQQKLYQYKYKFASKPYHANLRTKQIVIDIMKLFENWGSKFFSKMLLIPIAFLTCCPWPFEHTAHDLWRIRQQETFGRSKLWSWRHRCTVRGSTLGAVYTSCYT